MNNKEASAYFRNKMFEGHGLKEVDLPQFCRVLGVSEDDPADEVSDKMFEIFDGKEWIEINPFELEPGQKVVRTSLKDKK